MSQPPIFSSTILNHWAQWVGQSYDKELNSNERNWIRNNLYDKIGYWANSIVRNQDGWKKKGSRDFLVRSRDKFRHYIWLKLLRSNAHPELYFTISIDNDSGKGIPGLVIKLDFQRSGSKHLNHIQYKYLEKRLDRKIEPACWCNIEDYEEKTWQELIELSVSFIESHKSLYEELNNELNRLDGKYRLARLCWNPEGWIKPSGKEGKSEDKDSHEYKYGFGHEEWLFDTTKELDGFHFSFLEPIFKNKESYIGEHFNIGLYTIDGKTKNRYWIGVIKDVEVIGKQESDKIKKVYSENGWYKNMAQQLIDVGCSDEFMDIGTNGQLFNIKFKPENMEVLDYELIPKGHSIYSISRYTFIKSQEIIGSILTSSNTPNPFKARNGNPNNSEDDTTYLRKPKMVQVSKKHNQIQKKLYEYLSKLHGEDNVTWEFLTGLRTQVDLVRKKEGTLIFYEIKTYPSLRASIREALGQLLEYGHWIPRTEEIEFVIVTDLPLNEDAKSYISTLRLNYNISISYAYFNLRSNQLVEYQF